jgi:prepilin-type N-terminal cleavage/methylation domain-containing protein
MRARRGDAGFTLTELLLSVGILGIIAPVIAGATVVGWQTTDATIAHLKDTGNRQLVQAWFVRDSQSAATVDVSSAPRPASRRATRWSSDVAGPTRCRARRSTAPRRTSHGQRPPSYQVVRAHATTARHRWPAAGSTTIARWSPRPHRRLQRLRRRHGRLRVGAEHDADVTDASGSFTSTGRRRSL